MKERNDDANRWGDLLCSWTGRVGIGKMTILPKAVFRFTAIWSNYQWHFSQHLKKKFVWKFRTPKQPKQSWERKTELEGSGSLTSEFTTRPQGSRQYNTGTKNKYRSVGQDGTPRDEPRGPWAPHTWHRRHGVYDGEKTVSSVSAAVKTGQLHVKEPRTLPNATHKLKEDYRPEGKARHCKTLKGKTQAEHSKKLHQDLFWPPSYSNKNKNKQVGHN